MTRDYKNARVRDRGLPGWIFFLAGLAVGLSVAAMVWLGQNPAPQIAFPPDLTSRQDTRDVRKDETEEVPAPERRFDFYTLLPELEVVVPESEPAATSGRADDIPAPDPQPAAGGYILQVGSFKTFEQADSLKARLALLGVKADIQSVKVNNDTWHRVRLGPYQNMTRVDQVRAELRERKIDTLLLRVRE